METSLPSLLLQLLHGFALWLLSSVHIALAIAVTLHALMKKDEVHAAVGWIGLAWLAPFGGALAYWLLGINRIGRTGVALGLRKAWQSEGDLAEVFAVPDEAVDAPLGGVARVTDELIDVALPTGPLHVLLAMAGLDAFACRPPWLSARVVVTHEVTP